MLLIFVKLNDFLSGKIIPEEFSSTISLKKLFEKHKSAASFTNHLAASRLMLKKLGFKFFVDQNSKYMVKLPERSLEPKLRLISRCLLMFESIFCVFKALLFLILRFICLKYLRNTV